jgi:hypothetical protein
MACPFLRGTLIPVCTVHDGSYCPGTFELEEYCRSDKTIRCPYPSLRLFGIGRSAHGDRREESFKKAA